jgi:homoserine kinase
VSRDEAGGGGADGAEADGARAERPKAGGPRSEDPKTSGVGRRVKAYGPACLGNVAAGFDVLGAALAPESGEAWGDLVEMVVLDEGGGSGGSGGRGERGAAGVRVHLVCGGAYAHQLPADPADNLAVKACAAVARRLGRPLPPLALRLDKGLPVGSGLGSSSATVVAVVRALERLLGQPFGEVELLAAAGEAEAHASGAAHLDNVAAALFGGLRLVDPGGRTHRLPFPEELRFVLAVPELTLATRAARAALPAAVSLGLAVAHAQNLASLVHALHAGEPELLRACLRDLLAEPHRAGLVPGFREVQAAALRAGAWGCSLSGAGPATFAVAASAAAAPPIGEAMRRAWAGAGIGSTVRVCCLDRRGARVLEEGAAEGAWS